MLRFASAFAVLAASLITSCSSAPAPIPVPAGTPALGTYANSEMIAEARAILTEIGATEVQVATVAQRMGEMLADPEFATRSQEAGGVNAVIGITGASGGFIIRSGGGNGAASFAGGSQRIPVKSEGMGWGGTVGGGGVVGVAVVMGMEHEELLQDRYSVTLHSGTMGDTAFMFAYGEAERSPHTIWFTGTGSGFGADVGYSTTDITFVKQDQD